MRHAGAHRSNSTCDRPATWAFVVEKTANWLISPLRETVTVSHMTDERGTVQRDSHGKSNHGKSDHDKSSRDVSNVTSVVELHNQLNRAYLSGDGAAVERVLALLAVAHGDTRAGASKAA